MEQLQFPPGLSDEVKLQVIRFLTDKDKELEKKEEEIKGLYKQIIKLESDLGKFNGALNYNQSEALKTDTRLAQYEVEAVARELKKRHLKIVKVKPTEGFPAVKCADDVLRPFDIKIEKITLWQRFKKWSKCLIPFEIKRKELTSNQ